MSDYDKAQLRTVDLGKALMALAAEKLQLEYDLSDARREIEALKAQLAEKSAS